MNAQEWMAINQGLMQLAQNRKDRDAKQRARKYSLIQDPDARLEAMVADGVLDPVQAQTLKEARARNVQEDQLRKLQVGEATGRAAARTELDRLPIEERFKQTPPVSVPPMPMPIPQPGMGLPGFAQIPGFTVPPQRSDVWKPEFLDMRERAGLGAPTYGVTEAQDQERQQNRLREQQQQNKIEFDRERDRRKDEQQQSDEIKKTLLEWLRDPATSPEARAQIQKTLGKSLLRTKTWRR